MTAPDIVVNEAGPSLNQTKLNPVIIQIKRFLEFKNLSNSIFNLKTRHIFKKWLCQVKNLRINLKIYVNQ